MAWTTREKTQPKSEYPTHKNQSKIVSGKNETKSVIKTIISRIFIEPSTPLNSQITTLTVAYGKIRKHNETGNGSK